MLPKCPIYKSIIARARTGARVVDIGCFLGHDLRRLTFDGAPSANLVGVDIINQWDLGYSFFRDHGRFAAKFVEADILHPNAELRSMEGGVDVAVIVHLLHQWDYDRQLEAAQNVGRLMAVGGIVVGFQLGTAGREQYADPTGPTVFWHTVESFRGMWEEVGRRDGTVWETQAELWALGSMGSKEEDVSYLGKECRVLQFVVTRKA
jgi:SAM-dependent methyltransferase